MAGEVSPRFPGVLNTNYPVAKAGVIVTSPTSTSLAPFLYTDKQITVTKLLAVLQGSSSPSVTWTIRYAADWSGTGTEIVTSGTTTTSVSTGSIITTFNSPVIPPNNWVWFKATAQSGTVTTITINMYYF